MRTNIEIDDELMAKAQKLTNIKTKKILVDNALRLYVTVENHKKLLELWGKVEIYDKAFEQWKLNTYTKIKLSKTKILKLMWLQA